MTPPSSVEDTPPVLEKGDEVQLEPTQDEMERERLATRAEQVSRPFLESMCLVKYCCYSDFA